MRAIIHGAGAFTPEDATVLVTAFEDTLDELGMVNRDGPLALIIAKKIITLANQGESDPEKLRVSTLAGLGLGPSRRRAS